MSTKKEPHMITLDLLLADLFAYRLRTGDNVPVVLVGELAWRDLVHEFRLWYGLPPPGANPCINISGWNCYFLPCYGSDKWLIGRKEDMLLLRTLWMAAKDKEIRIFLQQWEESERKQRN